MAKLLSHGLDREFTINIRDIKNTTNDFVSNDCDSTEQY